MTLKTNKEKQRLKRKHDNEERLIRKIIEPNKPTKEIDKSGNTKRIIPKSQ